MIGRAVSVGRVETSGMAGWIAVLLAPFLLLGGCSLNAGMRREGLEPRAEVRIVQAIDVGTLEFSPLIRGRDGGYSALFDGRSVWLFGDTLLERPNAAGESMPDNTWATTTELDATGGIRGLTDRLDESGAPSRFLPLTGLEAAFNRSGLLEIGESRARWALWPGALAPDPDRGRLLVFYSKIYAEAGSFNFAALGHSIAVWEGMGREVIRPEVRPGRPDPTLMFGAGEPSFGSGAVCVGDMLYAYGVNPADFSKGMVLGRVNLAEALNRGSWEYYTAGGWSGELREAVPVFEGNDIISVWFSECLDRYVALYSQPMTRDVMVRTARAPEGPWSVAVRAFRAWQPRNRLGWIYDALAHPEFRMGQGCEISVTYSREIGFLSMEMRQVQLKLERN
jgi:hypothetical protein